MRYIMQNFQPDDTFVITEHFKYDIPSCCVELPIQFPKEWTTSERRFLWGEVVARTISNK